MKIENSVGQTSGTAMTAKQEGLLSSRICELSDSIYRCEALISDIERKIFIPKPCNPNENELCTELTTVNNWLTYECDRVKGLNGRLDDIFKCLDIHFGDDLKLE